MDPQADTVVLPPVRPAEESPSAAAGEQPPPAEPPTKPPEKSAEKPPPSGGGGRARTIVRSIGELLITMGVVVLLFVVYELYVTNLMSAELQREASASLEQEWENERQLRADLADGQAFARLYIPAFGADYDFTIQQGVDSDTLEIGPGHYRETAMPGEPGNVGVAGHRVGKGAPFNDLDLLGSCDAIVVETLDSFFVYRVLPMEDELADWPTGKGSDPKCAGVPTLRNPEGPTGSAYDETVGRRIVLPGRGDAVAPVPYKPAGTLPDASQAALLTLTTCHPQFSDRERLIIHSVLTNQYAKEPGATYLDLLKKIGEA
ncbi:class E sortase [Amycolatopsis cihanbeyliensis]|uniref:LPXTG-site transpeptidase (Sortase) family protein n=1 Tax=Amycolatopsis cihanbeyliensis TaxID=1128664 RepID=A0A542DLC5_AMYCI|nr:class E sortase [Amycolatopsis cihanbeyliensis]TQJ03900.1 LPXTG-site transpeptidase (sortase) family protein [Amycolatopsis cihanbeyliensis]